MAKTPLTIDAVRRFFRDETTLTVSWKLQPSTALVLVKTGGRKDSRDGTYYIRHRGGNKDARLPLGTASNTTPELMREAALAVIQEARDKGIDLERHIIRRAQMGQFATQQAAKTKDWPVGSFGHLLDYYEESVTQGGKNQDGSIGACLNASVRKYNTDLLAKPACEVTTDDILDILKRRVDQGITGQVNKLHTYLHAAFNRVISKDKIDPLRAAQTGQMGLLFAVEVNPVSRIGKVKEFEKARDRHLSRKELRRLLRLRDQVSPQHTGFIYLTLFSCVRPLQMVQVPWANYDLEAKQMLSLREWIKQKQFDHINPIIPALEAELERQREFTGHLTYPCTKSDRTGVPYDEHLNSDGFDYRVKKYILDAKDEDGEPLWKYKPFQTRDLRETISYHMSEELEIEDDVIRLLQVHSLGTAVTTINYGRYRKTKAKQRAMDQWQEYLEELAGKPLRPTAGA